jgi:MFS family permease
MHRHLMQPPEPEEPGRQPDDDHHHRQPRHDAYSAIRSANYRWFAGGYLVSSTGLQMLSMAIGWEIYERTNRPEHLGYVGLARALPVVLLALPAGHLIDTFNRKHVLIVTQLAFAVLTLLLAWASWQQSPLWLIYLLLTLSAAARVFNGPSRATLLPLIVPRKDFHNATTWNSGVFQASAMGGPTLAGLLIAYTGAAWPVYVATAFACAAFAAAALMIHPEPSRRLTDPWSWRSITAGMSHLWREKTILGAITLDLFAVLLGGAMALLPVYAKDILHVGAQELGYLRSAPYVGAFIMAVWLAHRPAFTRAGPILLASVTIFGIAMVVFGLSTAYWLSMAALFIGGAADNVSVVIRHVLVQLRTPDHLRGRVSSVNSVFIESSNELGAFRAGLFAAWLGPVGAVVSGGVGTVLVVLGVAWLIPAIRKMRTLDELPHEDAAGGPAHAAESTRPAAG